MARRARSKSIRAPCPPEVPPHRSASPLARTTSPATRPLHLSRTSTRPSSLWVTASFAPEYNWDDYKGTDVKGKIVLVIVNEPGDDADPKFFQRQEPHLLRSMDLQV